MPLDYIERIDREIDRVCLVHFNGSRKSYGCCADGHGHVTRIQNIPDSDLIGLLEISTKLNIPCLTE
jgi:hypothetical protein